ncbi:MAG: 50S ribosomal protein L25 [Planctomycetota bacterium]|nr:MAG: 50S ribosomal protein L25 [Planctomycetota bacterium]
MSDKLKVQMRETRGKRNARRLRDAGSIPAILYGHGEANQSLTVNADEMAAAVRHGSHVVELTGAVTEKAFIRDLQWDVYGQEVLHVDFTRVSEHERVEVKVAVELRGEAPGSKEGGNVEQLAHELEIDCEAVNIPAKIEVNINDLQLNETLTVADLELPPGVKVLDEPEMPVVQCLEVREEEEEEAVGEPGSDEPEIIGRAAEEEGEEEGD